MDSFNWCFAFASAPGNSHIRENIPCQDSCDLKEFDNFIIAVVADGAGSCKHSDQGSKTVVDSSLYQFEKLVKDKGWNKDYKLPNEELWHKCAKQTLFTIKEDLIKYSLSHELELNSLSCTIIVVIVFTNGFLITHIGDGRAGYCNSNLEWSSSMNPVNGEFANQTVFITSNIWDEDIVDDYVKSKVINDEVKAFCLLTDGAENASFECNLYDTEKKIFYDPNKPYAPFFNPNVKQLKQLNFELKSQEEINELWERFLLQGNSKLEKEEDDKTIVLGVRL